MPMIIMISIYLREIVLVFQFSCFFLPRHVTCTIYNSFFFHVQPSQEVISSKLRFDPTADPRSNPTADLRFKIRQLFKDLIQDSVFQNQKSGLSNLRLGFQTCFFLQNWWQTGWCKIFCYKHGAFVGLDRFEIWFSASARDLFSPDLTLPIGLINVCLGFSI